MKVIGNAAAQECGRWLNNRAENSHQPFQRRERAIAKFGSAKLLQKFASIVLPFSVVVANIVILDGLVKMVGRDGEE